MSQTQNQSKYYYSPRFRHFNIYRRDPDGDTKVDDAATQEEAKRKVYELNSVPILGLTVHCLGETESLRIKRMELQT